MSKTISLKIDGMHCQSCVKRVTMALGRLPGVKVEAVEIGSAKVEADEQATAEQVKMAVNAVGFEATVA